MSRHWTKYAQGEATQKQAFLLDRLADQLRLGDGLDLIAASRKCSRSAAYSPSMHEASKAIDYGKDRLARREAEALLATDREALVARCVDLVRRSGVTDSDVLAAWLDGALATKANEVPR